MSNIARKIKLTNELHDWCYWNSNYSKEYEDLNFNTNNESKISLIDINNIWDKHIFKNILIQEQILLILCKSSYNFNPKLKEWLKLQHFKLFKQIQKSLQNKSETIQHIVYEITAKIKLIFKLNGNIWFSIDNLDLKQIVNEVENLYNDDADIHTIWNDIQQYRYKYNQYIKQQYCLLKHIQIGIPCIKRIHYTIPDTMSILTYYAKIYFMNRQSHLTNFKLLDKLKPLQELQNNPPEYRMEYGSFNVSTIFKQLHIISKHQLLPNRVYNFMKDCTEIIPQCIHKFLPPIMSPNCIRKYLLMQQDWYYININKYILNDDLDFNPVVNGALDAAKFKGHWGNNDVPMELTMYVKNLHCGFRVG